MAARHPLAWLAWLALAFTAALTTRNPLYLALALLALLAVYQTAARHSATGPAWGAFIRLGLTLAVIGVGFDALTAHLGDTVLFSLPADWPIIGGRISLEAIVHGLLGVLQLACLLVAGAAFSLRLDSAALLRLTPAPFYQAGLALTIGLAYIPQTVQGFQEIREAQRIRGHQFRGPRDVLPLVGPLLTTGLERSVQLAESLEARGFGYSADARRVTWPAQLGLFVGGLLLGGGLFSLGFWGRQPWGAAAVVVGGVGLGWTLHSLAPREARTRYTRLVWSRGDTRVAGVSLAGLGLLGALVALQPLSLFYTPYPALTPPPFAPLVGVGYLLLLAPLMRLEIRD